MSELSEMSGECQDCEYNDECICSEIDEGFDESDCLRTCPDCWNREDFCECGELPPEAKHDVGCPCSCCVGRPQNELWNDLASYAESHNLDDYTPSEFADKIISIVGRFYEPKNSSRSVETPLKSAAVKESDSSPT